MGKKLYIKTWGCQMNVYDSQRMADLLAPIGYAPTEDASVADMVILNTCHIREKAAEKLYSELGRMRPHKEARKAAGEQAILAVAGCVAQAEGREIIRRQPAVDLVVGPQSFQNLPDLVLKLEREATPIVQTDFPVESKFDALPEENAGSGVSAFLAVQEGCDKFCTFCVVPYTRGAEYSRPVQQILDEAKRLIAGGAREITLLGQNVNAWHGEGPDGRIWSLARLIQEMAELENLWRIRFTTSHPRDMKADLIAAHATVPQLMPYLHLPIQSGSDRILKAMNRKHKADFYRRIIDRLRHARPDIALSGDFIVGFPGETDEDFAETLQLVQDVTYAQAYSFKYSPRPGTPAASQHEQVPEEVKSERLVALQALLTTQQHSFNRSKQGLTLPVLFDRKGKREGQLLGRSPWLQSVFVEAPARLMGQMVDVRITGAHRHSLTGEIVMQEHIQMSHAS